MRREQARRGRSNGRGESKLQELIKKTPNLKRDLEALINEERDVIEEGSEQVKRLYQYLKSNWKTVMPALAVLGVGAFLFTRNPNNTRNVKVILPDYLGKFGKTD